MYRAQAISVEQMRLAPAAGGCVDVEDNSDIFFQAMQMRSPGTPFKVSLGNPNIDIVNSDIAPTGSGIFGVVANAGALEIGQGVGTGVLIRGLGGGSTGVQVTTTVGATLVSAIFDAQVSGFTNGIQVTNSVSLSGSISITRIDCADSTGVGVILGGPNTGIVGFNGTTTIATTNITTCGTGVQLIGAATTDITSLSGSVATTGFAVSLGAMVNFTKAGTTITAGTNEINLDSGLLTAAFADVNAGACVNTLEQSSRVCGR